MAEMAAVPYGGHIDGLEMPSTHWPSGRGLELGRVVMVGSRNNTGRRGAD